MNPRALVVRTAGTNCDVESAAACEKVGFEAERVHVRRLIERPSEIDRFQFVVLPGGFSYGDDLGAGTIHGNEIRLFLSEALGRLRDRGGLVIGICNGFQVLVKSGLLGSRGEFTLAPNASGRFEARWVTLNPASRLSPFIRGDAPMDLPVAHGEGRFTGPAPALDRLERAGQVVLRYAQNPNGSDRDIAGLCDPTGRVMGLMPHPERYQDATNHPEWTRRGPREPDGLTFFANAFHALHVR